MTSVGKTNRTTYASRKDTAVTLHLDAKHVFCQKVYFSLCFTIIYSAGEKKYIYIFFSFRGVISLLNASQQRKQESWNQWSQSLNIVLSVLFYEACG